MGHSKDDHPAVTCMAIGAVLVSIPVTVITKGFVLAKLWGWFVVPLGVPAISLLHAYGLALVAALLCPTPQPKTGEGKTTATDLIAHALVTALIGPGLLLVVGWFIWRLWA